MTLYATASVETACVYFVVVPDPRFCDLDLEKTVRGKVYLLVSEIQNSSQNQETKEWRCLERKTLKLNHPTSCVVAGLVSGLLEGRLIPLPALIGMQQPEIEPSLLCLKLLQTTVLKESPLPLLHPSLCHDHSPRGVLLMLSRVERWDRLQEIKARNHMGNRRQDSVSARNRVERTTLSSHPLPYIFI